MSYTVTPSNYDAIASYVIEYGEEALRGIITAQHCYIIDTCSVEFYKKENRVKTFVEYVKQTNGCVIIFRTILMEMCGDREAVDDLQIGFVKHLYDAGINVYVLYEEAVYQILNAYTSKAQVAMFFKYAVLCVKGPAGLLNIFLNDNQELMRSITAKGSNIDEVFFSQFWSKLRQIKEHKDNLGEVVCAICIHMLANMEDINKFKYIFTTEDKPAIKILSRVINNHRQYQTSSNDSKIGAATSTKIVEEMYRMGIMTSIEDITAFYEPFNSDTRIKATVKGRFDIEPRERSFTVDEFAEFVVGAEGNVFC